MPNKRKNVEIGGRYNSLRVSSIPPNQTGVTKAVFICDCGEVTELELSRVVSGYIKSCGCSKEQSYKKLVTTKVGDTFTRLKVLEIYSGTAKNGTSALCRCDCGNTKITTLRSLKRGDTKSCGCLNLETRMRIGKESFRGYEQIHLKFFNDYRNGAKRRNIIFDIKIEDVWNLYIKQDKKCKLSNLDIHFNAFGHGTSSNKTVSLDRIDSSKNYTLDNIQLLHKDINEIKWNFDQQYFISLCKLISNPIYCTEKYQKLNTNMTSYEDISMIFWNTIKAGAASRNLSLDITMKKVWDKFIEQNANCALSGQRLSFSRYSMDRTNNTASLDRIDSSKGYTIDNTRWIHKHINNMKKDYNDTYFKYLCSLVSANAER